MHTRLAAFACYSIMERGYTPYAVLLMAVLAQAYLSLYTLSPEGYRQEGGVTL